MKRDLNTKTLFISLISVGIIGAPTPHEARILRHNLVNAILGEKVEEVGNLIKEGAPVNVTLGTKPIIAATQMATIPTTATTGKDDRKMAQITRILLRNEANPAVKDASGMTPLMWAARNGANRILRELLRNKKAQATINMEDRNGDTALIWAAKATILPKKYLATARALLKKKANPDIKNKKGESAFFYAKESGNTKMVELLRRYMPKRPPMTIMPVPIRKPIRRSVIRPIARPAIRPIRRSVIRTRR